MYPGDRISSSKLQSQCEINSWECINNESCFDKEDVGSLCVTWGF